jgi:hypothetical protein
MSHEFSRNISDAEHIKTFTLPASASTSTQNATGFDLGADIFKGETVEVSMTVPALSATLVPDTRTTTYILETSTASNFATIDATLYTKTFTASGGAGVAAQDIRVRLPSNCARYLRGKVTHGASTTDSSAITATVALKF